MRKLIWLIPALAAYAVPGWGAPFHADLELQGITFAVDCPNSGSLNTLTVSPKGLKGDSQPITREIDGTVTEAQVGDLNHDGFPEVYVFTTSAGSGSYGNVVGYAVNKKKSLTEIFLPPLADSRAAMKGYMGHDRFELVEGRLVRQFPIYLPNDANANPTSGKLRQIQYRLVAGEAGWMLRPYKIFDIKLTPP